MKTLVATPQSATARIAQPTLNSRTVQQTLRAVQQQQGQSLGQARALAPRSLSFVMLPDGSLCEKASYSPDSYDRHL